MAETATGEARSARFEAGDRAWSDALLDWIEGRPWPLAFSLVVLALASIGIVHAIEWRFGSVPAGELDLYRSSIPLYPVGILAAIAIQNRVSAQALDTFRPATNLTEDEYQQWRHELTHDPPRASAVAAIAMSVLGIIVIVTAADAAERRDDYPVAFAADMLLSFVTYSFAGPFLIRAYRLLRMVARLHRQAVRIDLFHPEPLHAFSIATATVGVSLIGIVTLSLLTDPTTDENAASLALSMVVTVMGGACFVVPLWGMHRRLLAERERLASEVSTRIETMLARLYERVDREEPGAAEIKDHMTSLVSARELIGGLSTWPWQPETPRWLFSALLIPLVLWGATRLLERAGL